MYLAAGSIDVAAIHNCCVGDVKQQFRHGLGGVIPDELVPIPAREMQWLTAASLRF
jgi:hypothetical protein